MNTQEIAAKIVGTYHHQNRRFFDGLVTRQTAQGAYHRAMVEASEGLATSELVEMLDTFEVLYDAHVPSCPICSQKGL
jgi:hypothetical protein